MSSGSISAIVYKISSKSDDFSPRYGDLKWQLSAILDIFVITSQYCIAGHIFVVSVVLKFHADCFVVSEMLAISEVCLSAVHNGPWQFWGCACAASRDP